MKNRTSIWHVMIVIVVFGFGVGLTQASPFETASDGSQCCPRFKGETYAAQDEFSVEGVVEEVLSTGRNRQRSEHLVVRTEKLLYKVHLGPKRFLILEEVYFEEDDEVRVVCAPIEGLEPEKTDDGTVVVHVVAREVQRGKETLTLRDEQGTPRWERSP